MFSIALGSEIMGPPMQVPRNSNNNMQNDETFLLLLSSQRELLNQLHMENALRQAEQQNYGGRAAKRGLGAEQRLVSNRPIVDRRTSMDMLLSKRFSLGLGSDHFILPSYSVESTLGDFVYQNVPEIEPKESNDLRFAKVDQSDHDRQHHGKKRRLSSIGFLSPTFFEDNLRASGHESVSFSMKPRAKEIASNGEDSDDDDLDEDDNDDDGDAASEIGKPSNDNISVEPVEVDQSIIDPAQLKSLMEAFNVAMERSQKSQQSIHDWDRKMGLKRSHSKTMRLSSRSRKKLRSILKKEISSLGGKL